MKNSRKIQFFGKVQAGQVYETPAATDVIPIEIGSTSQLTTEQIERNIAKITLSNSPSIPGILSGTMNITTETVNSDVVGSAPYVDPVLQGAGFVPSVVQVADITSGTIFKRGEVVTGGTSGATGKCVLDEVSGVNKIYLVVTSGSFNSSEAITGDQGGAGTMTSALSGAGVEYAFTSSDIKNVSFRMEEDGQTSELYNASSTLSFTGDDSNLFRIEAEIEGKINTDGGGYDPENYIWRKDIAETSGVVIPSRIPAILQSAEFKIGDYVPVISGSLVMDMQIEKVMRRNMNSPDGLTGMRVTARKPQLTYRIETPDNADFDYAVEWIGVNVKNLQFKYGQKAGATMYVFAPQTVVSNVSHSDENFISMLDITSELTGTNDDELYLLFI